MNDYIQKWPLLIILGALFLFLVIIAPYAPSYYYSPADAIRERFVLGVIVILLIRVTVAKFRKERNMDYVYYLGLLYLSPFIATAVVHLKYPNL